MSHDRGCYKCFEDPSEYKHCRRNDCPKQRYRETPVMSPSCSSFQAEAQANIIAEDLKWLEFEANKIVGQMSPLRCNPYEMVKEKLNEAYHMGLDRQSRIALRRQTYERERRASTRWGV